MSWMFPGGREQPEPSNIGKLCRVSVTASICCGAVTGHKEPFLLTAEQGIDGYACNPALFLTIGLRKITI